MARLSTLVPVIAVIAGGLCSTSALAQSSPAHTMFETVDTSDPNAAQELMWSANPLPMLPETAVASGVNMATVDLRCRARPDGGLSGCVILSESAEGVGLGRAALTAVRQWRLTSQSAATARQGARIMFSMTF